MKSEVGTRIRFRNNGREMIEATVEKVGSRGVWAHYDEPQHGKMGNGEDVELVAVWVLDGQYELVESTRCD